MKLPIKKKYFDAIKRGEKSFEFRDAHITFICEETGEQLRKEVTAVKLIPWNGLPKDLKSTKMFQDIEIIRFELEDDPLDELIKG